MRRLAQVFSVFCGGAVLVDVLGGCFLLDWWTLLGAVLEVHLSVPDCIDLSE